MKKAFVSWRNAGYLAILVASVALLGPFRFVLDPGATGMAIQADGFGLRHSCLTAYLRGAELARTGVSNLYDPTHYGTGPEDPGAPRSGFQQDTYPYPPPFLVLPVAAEELGLGFASSRALWFGLEVLVLGLALVCVARWSGLLQAAGAARLWPLVLAAPTTLLALQIGNAHALVLALAMLGRLGLQRGAPTLGGLLLGFAIATKLWPGILVLDLLIRRRWPAVLASTLGVLAWCAVAALLIGTDPFSAFWFEQLPRLRSGEAFPFLAEVARPVAMNLSVPAILGKLSLLGILERDGPLLSPQIGLLYPLLVLAALIATAKANPEAMESNTSLPETDARAKEVRRWLALLTLAQLHSPFLPWTYGVLAPLWLLFHRAAETDGRQRFLYLLAALGLAVVIPSGWLSTRWEAVWVLGGLAVILSVATLALFQPASRSRAIPSNASASA